MSIEEYEPSQKERRDGETAITDEMRTISLEREREIQERNFKQSLERVIERYPNLGEKIKISLETPQLGEHHNEGPKMDTHLSLILETLRSIKDGNFHETIADQRGLQEMMYNLVATEDPDTSEHTGINPVLVEYTFLHDISKPDCLTLKVEGEKTGIEVSWEQWQEIEKSGQPYRFEDKPVASISYYHQSEGVAGQHGNKAAEMLKDHNVLPAILIAISKHEVAYQFAKINAATYEEHFVKPGFTEKQQQFVLVASYIDTMASLLPDGKADISNFINLVKSRNNYLLIKEYLDQGARFRENELIALKKQDKVLTQEDVEKRILKEEKYNIPLLGEKLEGLVSGGQITDQEKELILSTISSEPNELGRRFGPKMRFIKPLLEQSKQ